MAILKTIWLWTLEWLRGLFLKWVAERADDKREEKEVDDIIDKTLDPDLDKQLEGIEDAEDRINENA